jgi:hypothetical protein
VPIDSFLEESHREIELRVLCLYVFGSECVDVDFIAIEEEFKTLLAAVGIKKRDPFHHEKGRESDVAREVSPQEVLS